MEDDSSDAPNANSLARFSPVILHIGKWNFVEDYQMYIGDSLYIKSNKQITVVKNSMVLKHGM